MTSFAPQLRFSSERPFLRLYYGCGLALPKSLVQEHESRFDVVFTDPSLRLSSVNTFATEDACATIANADYKHQLNREWLGQCEKVLKPNGTMWVTGTHHVMFSIGFALQQLGFTIVRSVILETSGPPISTSREFVQSSATLLWAAKNPSALPPQNTKDLWRISKVPKEEKRFGEYPTQKPLQLIKKCLLASTREGDLVFDPFLGNGSTAAAALQLRRGCVGFEANEHYLVMAIKRARALIRSLRAY